MKINEGQVLNKLAYIPALIAAVLSTFIDPHRAMIYTKNAMMGDYFGVTYLRDRTKIIQRYLTKKEPFPSSIEKLMPLIKSKVKEDKKLSDYMMAYRTSSDEKMKAIVLRRLFMHLEKNYAELLDNIKEDEPKKAVTKKVEAKKEKKLVEFVNEVLRK